MDRVHLYLQPQSNQWIFRDLPSDVSIEINDTIFALHKFPLASKSAKLRHVARDSSNGWKLTLSDIPGGAAAFEYVARFCYNVNFEITPANVAELRCVSHHLEMTEAVSDNNLAARTEQYLESVVLTSLTMCVEVLRHCETLLPLADELRVTTRCVDAIASIASAEQMASSLSRLMASQPKTIDDWWIEDLSSLHVDFYERVVVAMKGRGIRSESVVSSLTSFARNRLSNKTKTVDFDRDVIETVVCLLPDKVPTAFLFGLLRSAAVLDCDPSCRESLERRIAADLDSVAIDDLLIPSLNHASGTLYDVDTVQRILETFCFTEEDGSSSPRSPTAFSKVGKLVDSYLSQIATDANLTLSKFVELADVLPPHARADHDGLYLAIDMFLKEHEGLSENERKKLCHVVEFQRLTGEAAAHAAHNERLPLQTVVQVLYYEQMRLRTAYEEEDDRKGALSTWRVGSGALSPRESYASLRRENMELKEEVARLRMRLNDLAKEHVCMKREMSRRKLMSSFTRKVSGLKLFRVGSSSSRPSTSASTD